MLFTYDPCGAAVKSGYAGVATLEVGLTGGRMMGLVKNVWGTLNWIEVIGAAAFGAGPVVARALIGGPESGTSMPTKVFDAKSEIAAVCVMGNDTSPANSGSIVIAAPVLERIAWRGPVPSRAVWIPSVQPQLVAAAMPLPWAISTIGGGGGAV